MKRFFALIILTTSIVALTLYSCKKEQPDTEAQSAVDNSICEGEFSRMPGVVNDFGIKENGIKSYQRSSCPSITADSTARTMTLDYGTAGCQDTDGKYRKGIIKTKFSGKWGALSTTVVIKLQNYMVGNIHYGCDSIMITRNTPFSFTTTVVGGKCWNTAWNLEWAGVRTMTQIAGTLDTIASNDVFEFTGSATGKNRNAKTYTSTITVPIQKMASCNWINQGRLELIPEGLPARTIDYGIGTCDNDATLTINGNVYTFKLD